MAIALRRFVGWLPWALPAVGAVLSPAFIDSGGHWALDATAGALLGLTVALLIWQAKTVPPYSTWLGAFAAVAACLSLLLLAVFAWSSGLGTYIVILACTLVLAWAFTR
jgi:hypothetical protein